MAKIMLVEDDNNLREIYEARLLAEGYEIVAAHDGEEALALAVKEKPDLIISDVMMPKISGFDMLDILRSTPETKDTKVIMMTALSQAEDKDRADKLGADRYLVKSQVTLEDVAKIAREVLESATPGGVAPSMPSAPAADPAPVAPAEPVAAAPVVVTPNPVVDTPVVAAPSDPVAPVPDPAPVTEPTSVPDPAAVVPAPILDNTQTVSSEQSAVDAQVENFVATAPIATAPVADGTSTDASTGVDGKKIIQPLTDETPKPDLNKLLEEEEKKNPTTPPGEDPNLIAL